jgi:hypothetical protein
LARLTSLDRLQMASGSGGKAVPGERIELPTNGLQKRSLPLSPMFENPSKYRHNLHKTARYFVSDVVKIVVTHAAFGPNLAIRTSSAVRYSRYISVVLIEVCPSLCCNV